MVDLLEDQVPHTNKEDIQGSFGVIIEVGNHVSVN